MDGCGKFFGTIKSPYVSKPKGSEFIHVHCGHVPEGIRTGTARVLLVLCSDCVAKLEAENERLREREQKMSRQWEALREIAVALSPAAQRVPWTPQQMLKHWDAIETAQPVEGEDDE